MECQGYGINPLCGLRFTEAGQENMFELFKMLKQCSAVITYFDDFERFKGRLLEKDTVTLRWIFLWKTLWEAWKKTQGKWWSFWNPRPWSLDQARPTSNPSLMRSIPKIDGTEEEGLLSNVVANLRAHLGMCLRFYCLGRRQVGGNE